jgi:hypothetical protein
MPTLTEFFSMIGLGPSRQQLQKNEEIKKSGLSDAVEMDVMITGGKRRHSKRKASKRKASKRKCKASRRK